MQGACYILLCIMRICSAHFLPHFFKNIILVFFLSNIITPGGITKLHFDSGTELLWVGDTTVSAASIAAPTRSWGKKIFLLLSLFFRNRCKEEIIKMMCIFPSKMISFLYARRHLPLRDTNPTNSVQWVIALVSFTIWLLKRERSPARNKTTFSWSPPLFLTTHSLMQRHTGCTYARARTYTRTCCTRLYSGTLDVLCWIGAW